MLQLSSGSFLIDLAVFVQRLVHCLLGSRPDSRIPSFGIRAFSGDRARHPAHEQSIAGSQAPATALLDLALRFRRSSPPGIWSAAFFAGSTTAGSDQRRSRLCAPLPESESETVMRMNGTGLQVLQIGVPIVPVAPNHPLCRLAALPFAFPRPRPAYPIGISLQPPGA